ncbi:hypothetical protein ALC60_09973 [Trachymyrmex zeteki]|uniref:Replicase polyprotein 1a n=1 Tax=Mycetomoellerius zeteki TaxID=64791 RepID=A0A151WSK7_9HYME|nr:hypothetical protein ALC60_09973 [Trachymyrmex zeteki]
MLVAASKRGGEGYHRERRERRKKDNTCARACEREKEETKAKRGWNYRGREIRRKSGQNKEEGDKNQSGSQGILTTADLVQTDASRKQRSHANIEGRGHLLLYSFAYGIVELAASDSLSISPFSRWETERKSVAVPVTRSFTNGDDEEKYDGNGGSDDDDDDDDDDDNDDDGDGDDDDKDEEDVGVRDDTHRKTLISGVDA